MITAPKERSIQSGAASGKFNTTLRSGNPTFIPRILLMALVCLAPTLTISVRAAPVGFWDARFFVPGANEAVAGLAAHGNNLIAVGLFSGAGEVAANGVARWDGRRWHALGEGISSLSVVYFGWTAASDGSNVWIGGTFTNVGGVTAKGLAQWNGTHWSDVGGFSGQAGRLLYADGALYVAGNFTLPGATNGFAIGRWDGHAWETFDSSVSYCAAGCWTDMRAILPTRWGLLSANFFGLSAAYPSTVVLWNGANWVPVSGAPADWPDALTSEGDRVYAVCDRTVVTWDGIHWTQLGVADDWVSSLVVAQNKLWVGGQFDAINGVTASRVACWDGTNWSQPGADFRNADGVSALAATADGTVFAGGILWWSGSNAVSHVAQFSERDWKPVTSFPAQGLNASVGHAVTLAPDGDHLWVGGAFFTTGRSTNGHLARWDGASWSFLPGPMQPFNTIVRTLAATNGQLYLGGSFTNIAGVDLARIAHWDGAEWSDLGSGLDDHPEALLWSGTNLLVGGWFTNANGIPVGYIARWDGLAFHSIGAGFDATVHALAEFNGDWIAGGNFSHSGARQLSGLARWNGNEWTSVGGGLGGETSRVTRLFTHNDRLYVAGQFTSAGGLPCTNLAAWDGTNWACFGAGLPASSINGLAIYRGRLFASGALTNALGQRTALMYWNGTNWLDLPVRLQTVLFGERRLQGQGLAVWQDALYIGGRFDRAGHHAISGLARWVETLPQLAIDHDGEALRLRGTGFGGALHTLERSTDLLHWHNEESAIAVSDAVEWLASPTNAMEQFRIRVEP